MMSNPSLLVPNFEGKGVRRIFSQAGKLAAVYRMDQPGKTTVPLFTLRDKTYNLGHLQRQFPQQVRSAPSMMEVRECSWEEWRFGALHCDSDSLRRHGRQDARRHPLLTPEGSERIAAATALARALSVHVLL